jgi:hypothetical protein
MRGSVFWPLDVWQCSQVGGLPACMCFLLVCFVVW